MGNHKGKAIHYVQHQPDSMSCVPLGFRRCKFRHLSCLRTQASSLLNGIRDTRSDA